MDIFTSITTLVSISAFISYLNNRFIRLPGTIGVIVISVILSALISVFGKTIPQTFDFIAQLTNSIDFSKTLLDIMLGFLLFASALHFDFEKLKQHRWPVFILSTIGVVGSTLIFGFLLYGATYLLAIDLPLIY
jgi:CPA1 family monovalent cation:H+ antiporter